MIVKLYTRSEVTIIKLQNETQTIRFPTKQKHNILIKPNANVMMQMKIETLQVQWEWECNYSRIQI